MLTPAFDPKCNVSTSHTFWVINHKTEIISRPFPFPLFLRSVFMSWQIKHINKSHKALSFGNPQAKQWVSSKPQRNHQRCVQVSSIGCQIETQINSLHILIKQGNFVVDFTYYITPGTYCSEIHRIHNLPDHHAHLFQWVCPKGTAFDLSICGCNHWYMIRLWSTCTSSWPKWSGK